MPFHEYEAKVMVDDNEELSSKFRALGATLLRRIRQYDSYYDLRFRLTKKDELLRIRIEESIENQEFIAAEFSWKSGRKGVQYEVREDTSIPLITRASAETLERILFRLGFQKLAWLRKDRDRWRLKKVDFEFDKNINVQAIRRPTKNIGSYLQATIETNEEYTPIKMEKLLWGSLTTLGFDRTQLCWESYIELYLKLLGEANSVRPHKKREV